MRTSKNSNKKGGQNTSASNNDLLSRLNEARKQKNNNKNTSRKQTRNNVSNANNGRNIKLDNIKPKPKTRKQRTEELFRDENFKAAIEEAREITRRHREEDEKRAQIAKVRKERKQRKKVNKNVESVNISELDEEYTRSAALDKILKSINASELSNVSDIQYFDMKLNELIKNIKVPNYRYNTDGNEDAVLAWHAFCKYIYNFENNTNITCQMCNGENQKSGYIVITRENKDYIGDIFDDHYQETGDTFSIWYHYGASAQPNDYFILNLTKSKNLYNNEQPGWFPYIIDSDDDLRKFAIPTSKYNYETAEPCLLTTFRSSGLFTKEELNKLSDMLLIQRIPLDQLETIATEMNVRIIVYIYNSTADEVFNRTKNMFAENSRKEYNKECKEKSLSIAVMFGHYMIYSKNNGRDFKDIYKKPCDDLSQISNIIVYIYNAWRMNKLIIRDKIPVYRYVHKSNYNISRPVSVKDARHIVNRKYAHSERFYGFKISSRDEDIKYVNILQKIVNNILPNKKVCVNDYSTATELSWKLAYEFGVFDGVYEMVGSLSDKIASQCKYPGGYAKPGEYTDMIYLDVNAMFPSCMVGIPTGPNADGPLNTKITEYVRKLYEYRLKLKKMKSPLQQTVKCWLNNILGKSKQKLKRFKTSIINPEDIEANVEKYDALFTSCLNKGSNVVCMRTLPINTNYNVPQFAKTTLDNVNKLYNEIFSRVDVVYSWVDSFMIKESDLYKLNDLLDNDKLGMLKVADRFKNVKIYGKNKYIAVRHDDTVKSVNFKIENIKFN